MVGCGYGAEFGWGEGAEIVGREEERAGGADVLMWAGSSNEAAERLFWAGGVAAAVELLLLWLLPLFFVPKRARMMGYVIVKIQTGLRRRRAGMMWKTEGGRMLAGSQQQFGVNAAAGRVDFSYTHRHLEGGEGSSSSRSS